MTVGPENVEPNEESEYASLMLAAAAVEGLEDAAAGRLLDEIELERALSDVPQQAFTKRVT